jgi:Trypsin-like peptidase domain
VSIGERLAITAKHVILDFIQRLGTKQTAPDQFRHDFSLHAAQVLDHGESAVLWNIIRIWRPAYTDIVFMLLEPRVEESLAFPWKKVAMDLRPLQMGSRIIAFGYSNPSISIDPSINERIIGWNLSPYTSTGVITDIFYERRDSSSLNFPCYQTNARFDHSMSGGPVFTEEGSLCGVICSGFDFGEADEEPISYVAALWPSMATPININRKGFPQGLTYPILELARDGFIEASGWENVSLDVNPITGKPCVTYKAEVKSKNL